LLLDFPRHVQIIYQAELVEGRIQSSVVTIYVHSAESPLVRSGSIAPRLDDAAQARVRFLKPKSEANRWLCDVYPRICTK
jgi:hypothetical protein